VTHPKTGGKTQKFPMQIPNAGRQYFLPYSPDRQSFIGLYKCFNERLNQWISSPIDYNYNKIRLKSIIMYIKNIISLKNIIMQVY